MRRKRRRGQSMAPLIQAQDSKSLIIREAKAKAVLPIISDTFFHNLLFRRIYEIIETEAAVDLSPHRVLQTLWAEEMAYNMPGPRDFAATTQYLLVMSDETDRHVKQKYLNFLSSILDDLVDEDVYETLTADLAAETWSFSEKAALIEAEGGQLLDFAQGRENPLLQLADLDLPVYLTTSYHGLLETALKRAHKEPQVDFFRWNDRLKLIPFQVDETYDPTPRRPLVYHLHGLDSEPHSLVLTEEDHLEFLISLRQDRDTFLPLAVREALVSHPLLMLGYQPEAWDFKILFQGLIKNRQNPPKSVCVQVAGGEANARYLENYLRQAQFEVIWEDATHFLRELWQGVKLS